MQNVVVLEGPLQLRPRDSHEIEGNQSLSLLMQRGLLRKYKVLPNGEVGHDGSPGSDLLNHFESLVSAHVPQLHVSIETHLIADGRLRDEQLDVARVVHDVRTFGSVARVEDPAVLLALQEAAKALQTVIGLDRQQLVDLHLRGQHVVQRCDIRVADCRIELLNCLLDLRWCLPVKMFDVYARLVAQ